MGRKRRRRRRRRRRKRERRSVITGRTAGKFQYGHNVDIYSAAQWV